MQILALDALFLPSLAMYFHWSGQLYLEETAFCQNVPNKLMHEAGEEYLSQNLRWL